MVYSNKFIAVIKCKGKVLREFSDGVVRLPFGSDYSIYLKNKDTRKALVNIKVDGKDVLDYNKIIVGPNETTELKGFMKGSTVRNKFRFINKTKEISKFRGDFLEDGLVEIEYQFEKTTPIMWAMPYEEPRAKSRSDFYGGVTNDNVLMGSVTTSYCSTDLGITVPGSETRQSFVTGSINTLETEKYNIIIHLKGEIKTRTKNIKKKVGKAITVKTKIQCQTCGRRWKSSMKYCGNCSTYLH